MRKRRRRRKKRKRLLSMTWRPWTLTKIVGEVGARLRKGIGKRKETEIDIEIIEIETVIEIVSMIEDEIVTVTGTTIVTVTVIRIETCTGKEIVIGTGIITVVIVIMVVIGRETDMGIGIGEEVVLVAEVGNGVIENEIVTSVLVHLLLIAREALHDGDGRRMMTYWRMVSIAQDMESQGERGRKRKRRKRKKKSR